MFDIRRCTKCLKVIGSRHLDLCPKRNIYWPYVEEKDTREMYTKNDQNQTPVSNKRNIIEK